MKQKNNQAFIQFLFAAFLAAAFLHAPAALNAQENPPAQEETAQQASDASLKNAEEEKTDQGPEKETLWTFIKKGGITMFGLGLISTIILAFAMERILFFRRQKIQTKGIHEGIVNAINEGGLDAVEKFLNGKDALISRVLLAGLKVRHEGKESAEKAIENIASIELGKLEKGLNLLNNLGNLAPLIGFFGTVTGMRHSFLQFVEKAAPTAKDLAGGVEEALITTIAGLFIAIPAYLLYNLFIYYIDNVTIELEKSSNTITAKMN